MNYDKCIYKNKVKEVREYLKKSRSEFARLLGVSRQTLINIEECNHLPKISICLRIAKELNCSLDDLFYMEVN